MKPNIDLFIVGAQKSGTTSLLRYLGEHPSVLVHGQQEMGFFFIDEEYERGYANAFETYFSHTFAAKQHVQVVAAKHASQCHNEAAIRRLREHNPACKLVMVLRNPADRAYSSFLMEKRARGEEGTFDQVVADLVRNPSDWRYRAYLKYGVYHEDVRLLLKYFARDALTLVSFDELQADPVGVSQRIFAVLDVNPTFVPEVKIHNEGGAARSPLFAKFLHEVLLKEDNPLKKAAKRIMPPYYAAKLGAALRNLNRSTAKKSESMSPDIRKFLIEFYRPHNDALGDLLSRDFSHWNR